MNPAFHFFLGSLFTITTLLVIFGLSELRKSFLSRKRRRSSAWLNSPASSLEP